jgi:hypothetical protein
MPLLRLSLWVGCPYCGAEERYFYTAADHSGCSRCGKAWRIAPDGSIERSWAADDVADDVAVEGPQFLKYSASGKLLESRDISPTDQAGQ